MRRMKRNAESPFVRLAREKLAEVEAAMGPIVLPNGPPKVREAEEMAEKSFRIEAAIDLLLEEASSDGDLGDVTEKDWLDALDAIGADPGAYIEEIAAWHG